MKTTQKINIDLIKRRIAPTIHAVQGDASTRRVEITLTADKAPWAPPRDAVVVVRYRRPNQTGGSYDTLPEGEPAGTIHGNTVTVTLAAEVLTVPGEVMVVVSLIKGSLELSTFEIIVAVQANHNGSFTQGDPVSITGMLPAPDAGQTGQVLVISEINSHGKIQAVTAVDPPLGNSITDISLDSENSTPETSLYNITTTDDSGYTFAVNHGKSAYAYAKDGGYAGTEAEFAEKLAEEAPKALFIPVTIADDETCTAEITVAEIDAAYKAGRSVYALTENEGVWYPHFFVEGILWVFATLNGDMGPLLWFEVVDDEGTTLVSVDNDAEGVYAKKTEIPTVLPNPDALTIYGQSYDGSRAADFTDTISDMIDDRLPTALPNPYKLVFTGNASGEYDGSGEVTIHIPATGAETETVLSDNLFDKSTAVTGKMFYHSSSGPSIIDSYDSATGQMGFYAYVPLRGAGTYRTVIWFAMHGDHATRVPILKEDNTFLQNLTGTLTQIDGTFGYLEFTVTSEMVANGAAVYAFDGMASNAAYNIDSVMVVKDREYPEAYIPYGFIEVATDSGKKLTNNLFGKVAVFLGDSICAGTTVGDDSEYYGYGWAGLIGEDNQMTWANYGMNGGTVTDLADVQQVRWLSTQADTALAAHPSADYVIFEGGCNDADQMKDDGLGEISSDYATFDTTTFSGAFESLILKLLTAFPTAKIGYIIPQKMYALNDHTAAGHVHRRFFDRAIEICEKWGIPCLDLWKTNPLNPMLSTASQFYTDGQHLTLAGYQRITPQIEGWMRSML